MTYSDFAPETLELAASTMTGQLRDLVLDHMKDAKETLPWTMLTIDRQKLIIEFVENSVRAAVTQAVQLIARDGKRAVVAQVDQINVKDCIKIVLKTPKSEANLLTIGNEVSKVVLITVADDEPYLGGQERKPEDPPEGDLFPHGHDDGGPVFDGTPSGKGG